MKPLFIQYSTGASRSQEPFAWQAAGMGYIFRSSEGHFVVIDGGYRQDAEMLVRLMENYADGKPQVDYWIITHPHGDHYWAALEFSENRDLQERITVKRMLGCMPPLTFTDAGRGVPYEQEIRNVLSVGEKLKIPSIHAKKDDIYTADDIKIEILLTYDDLPFASDPNETSMLFRVTAADQTFLFLGDTYHAPAAQLAGERGKSLKSDFCQLAHHALNGADDSLYELVKPEIALIPMTRPAYWEMTEGSYADSDETAANRHLLLAMPKEKQWISADGDRVIDLPYRFQ